MAGAGHTHDHGASARRIFWALLLTGGFMIAEVIGGVISGSLALLADAAHMLIDTVSLLFAWLAFRLSSRPADRARTYGYHRFPVLAAFTNGIALVFIVIWIFIEAVERLFEPTEVLAGPMLVVAALGLAVNVAAFAVLQGADRRNLNVRGALLHVLGDMLGSVAAIAAALVIMTTGWMPIDPILSVLVGLLILRSAWLLVRDAAHVLLEGVPEALDVRDIGRDLVAHVPCVEDVHHVHAWSLSQDRSLLTLHARVGEGANPDSTPPPRSRRVSRTASTSATSRCRSSWRAAPTTAPPPPADQARAQPGRGGVSGCGASPAGREGGSR